MTAAPLGLTDLDQPDHAEIIKQDLMLSVLTMQDADDGWQWRGIADYMVELGYRPPAERVQAFDPDGDFREWVRKGWVG